MDQDSHRERAQYEDEAEEEYEGEYDEQYEDEEYESWATYEDGSSYLKPIVIGLVVAFLLAVGAVFYVQWSTDPATYFDEAPIVQQADEAPAAVTAVASAPRRTEEKAAGTEQRPAEPSAAKETEPTETPPAAAEEPAEPTAAEEPAEPVAEEAPAEEPAEPAEAAPAVGDAARYEELLASAKKARGMAKRSALLREAIQVNPRGDQAMAELAMMLMERKKTRAEALELASRAAEINPDNGMAWLVVGYVHQLDGKRAEAKDAYRKCAESPGPKRYVFECKRLV
jgi:tetratricopeptide (TPR) repeat protein